jgi:hypothetical protein
MSAGVTEAWRNPEVLAASLLEDAAPLQVRR